MRWYKLSIIHLQYRAGSLTLQYLDILSEQQKVSEYDQEIS